MSRLIRHYGPGQTYFITSVTQARQPILIENADLLWQSITRLKEIFEFRVIAYIIMPDHFHILINPGEAEPSEIIKRLKLLFSFLYREQYRMYRGRIWQARFWDHIIRNQTDWNNHVDYIHYNPVKHGYVKSPFDWKESSIHEYFDNGFYPIDWGHIDKLNFEGEYGE